MDVKKHDTRVKHKRKLFLSFVCCAKQEMCINIQLCMHRAYAQRWKQTTEHSKI